MIMMEKVLEEICSLRCERRYTQLDLYNVTFSYPGEFHDPMIKHHIPTNNVSFYTRRERSRNTNFTGWCYVSLTARQEGRILKSLYYTNDFFCTCPDYRHRKKKEKQLCKHMIDFEVKKETQRVTQLFTGETAIKTLIDAFVGQWEPPPKPFYHCEHPRCEKRAVWVLDDNTTVCKRHRPKVNTKTIEPLLCEEPWCGVKAKKVLPCGRKVCGRHIPKVEAKKL